MMGKEAHLFRFYITNMGNNDLILEYSWFTATKAHPDWTTGTLPATVIICTKGVASGKPMCSV